MTDAERKRSPFIEADGVPLCSEDACPMYDGKRCREMGIRPSRICEPEVTGMATEVRRLRAENAELHQRIKSLRAYRFAVEGIPDPELVPPKREISAFKTEDPETCAHEWERHLWEPANEYCPYCASTRRRAGPIAEPVGE